MGFRHWFKKTAKKAGKAIEKTAKDTGKAIDHTANQAIDGIDDLVKKAEKLGMSVIDDIKNLANKAKKEVEDTANKAKNEVEGVANKAKNEIEGVANQAKKEIPELAEKAVKDAIKAATSKGAKKGLEAALDIVELLSPDEYGLIIGIELALVAQFEITITMAIPNPVSKLTEIRKWAKNPPSGRSQMIACAKDFGPKSLQVEFKISGNGGWAAWSGDDKYDKLDAFLKKQGV